MAVNSFRSFLGVGGGGVYSVLVSYYHNCTSVVIFEVCACIIEIWFFLLYVVVFLWPNLVWWYIIISDIQSLGLSNIMSLCCCWLLISFILRWFLLLCLCALVVYDCEWVMADFYFAHFWLIIYFQCCLIAQGPGHCKGLKKENFTDFLVWCWWSKLSSLSLPVLSGVGRASSSHRLLSGVGRASFSHWLFCLVLAEEIWQVVQPLTNCCLVLAEQVPLTDCFVGCWQRKFGKLSSLSLTMTVLSGVSRTISSHCLFCLVLAEQVWQVVQPLTDYDCFFPVSAEQVW